MILEHALLSVRPEQAEDFEAAFAEAKPIISAMPGFRSLSLSRGIETPDTYLLLVAWERLADHVEGFRGSAGYQRWQQLLHHFYDPFPVVQHFAPIVGDATSDTPPAVTASTPNRQ
ncbi:antibiotic biosynthesis monooxygenase family protein [Nocardia sp. NBC_01009]|uniref:antibiotic biosynthesis monooxygenase family protein n=1 Tax=Nocardia sp. NBC_01009 TaxID=2975996 RepID=UPI003864E5F0|nr:antibiotic biosynthesis monooxygenase [Nocardia sp. NBC_01009]